MRMISYSCDPSTQAVDTEHQRFTIIFSYLQIPGQPEPYNFLSQRGKNRQNIKQTKEQQLPKQNIHNPPPPTKSCRFQINARNTSRETIVRNPLLCWQVKGEQWKTQFKQVIKEMCKPQACL